MGRRKKKTYEKQAVTAAEYRFVGGPRDDTEMRLVYPPPEQIRLAFPEWCTYQFVKDTKEDGGGYFSYIGDVRIVRNGLWKWKVNPRLESDAAN